MELYIKEVIYTYPLKLGSNLEFIFSNEEIVKGKVGVHNTNFFIAIGDGMTDNALIFHKLRITDKNNFVRNIVGYAIENGTHTLAWPEVKTLNDLEAVLRELRLVNLFTKKTPGNIIKVRTNKSIKLNFKL